MDEGNHLNTRSASCALIFMYGFENKTTNEDIDLMLEITEAFTFKIVIVTNEELVRPLWDKVPVLAFNDLIQVKYLCGNHDVGLPLDLMVDPWKVCPVFMEDNKELHIFRG